MLSVEMERAGLPAVIITALPSIASAAGANRILRGIAVTHPAGDPAISAAEESALRDRIFERAVALLETEVEPGVVWEVEQ